MDNVTSWKRFLSVSLYWFQIYCRSFRDLYNNGSPSHS